MKTNILEIKDIEVENYSGDTPFCPPDLLKENYMDIKTELEQLLKRSRNDNEYLTLIEIKDILVKSLGNDYKTLAKLLLNK
jgi:hypothetical protein